MSLQATTQASTAAATLPPGAGAVSTSLREFLAFKLGAKEYGIDILRVQEIRSYEEPTRIANATAPTSNDEASSRKTGTDDEWTSF